ncbi:MAG: SUMF1/EgtB/PvdO family nonheme iron enzyme [Xanthomonadaceae bacterium]|nr:SUMF1/EgtB/PvdO family nonheme iron enzyme [Xanthomonadaceae bacterium]
MRVLSGFLLLPVLLLAACGQGDDAPPAPTEAEARLRRGLVSVSEDEMPAYALDWRVPPVVVDAESLDDARERAHAALDDGRLYQDGDAAIPLYLAILKRAPDDEAARAGLGKARAALYAQGNAVLESEGADGVDLARAHEIAAVARVLAPDAQETLDYLARVDTADRLQALLEHGEEELAAGNLGETGIGAATAFREVLRNRPHDARAMQGLAAVESQMIARAETAIASGDYEGATTWLDAAATLRPQQPEAVQDARRALALQREARVARLYANVLQRLLAPGEFGALKAAQADIDQLRAVAASGDARVGRAEATLTRATRYGRHRPGEHFADALKSGGKGPELVVVPHGEFLMGAPKEELDSSKAEWPQHTVRFARGFAMARTETSVGEFRRFVVATGHRTRAERRGYSVVYDERSGNFVLRNDITWRHDYVGRPASPDLPVLHVDASDAEAYANWLSEESGQPYRLPHEAEFEYALRAGGQSRFPWGLGIPPRGGGNLTGSLDRSPSGRRWGNAFIGYGDGYWGPAPVTKGRANAFGLQGMAGNVGEWMMDCWHQGYRRAPADGGAWFNPGCRSRVVRGGTWSSAPAQARSAWRMSQAHDITNARTGIRLVREI